MKEKLLEIKFQINFIDIIMKKFFSFFSFLLLGIRRKRNTKMSLQNVWKSYLNQFFVFFSTAFVLDLIFLYDIKSNNNFVNFCISSARYLEEFNLYLLSFVKQWWSFQQWSVKIERERETLNYYVAYNNNLYNIIFIPVWVKINWKSFQNNSFLVISPIHCCWIKTT